jgi:DNA modification methylase
MSAGVGANYLLMRSDARRIPLPDRSVHAVVTSPPYWGGGRDYGDSRQIGLERQPEAYVSALVDIFREVRRVLSRDGTLWINVSDVYAASGKGGGGTAGERTCWDSVKDRKGFRMPPAGFKMKDLTLVAFKLADALRVDGWYLRSTIIWRKPAAVEPGRIDRPAVSHEYLFLLAPSEIYEATDPDEVWWHHTVWDVSSEHVSGHPAAMPSELARRCIVAGCPRDGIVLDPFAGSGTTLLTACRLGRSAVGCDLSADYLALAARRVAGGLRPVSKLDPSPARAPLAGQLDLF